MTQEWRESLSHLGLMLNLAFTLGLVLCIWPSVFVHLFTPLVIGWISSAYCYAYLRYPMSDHVPDN